MLQLYLLKEKKRKSQFYEKNVILQVCPFSRISTPFKIKWFLSLILNHILVFYETFYTVEAA
jgi:hypothetical protein